MASAQPAYRMFAYPEYAPERARRANVRVLPGRAPRTSETAAPSIATIARAIAVVLVFAAVLAFARIALTSATVSTLIESDTLSSEISEARSFMLAMPRCPCTRSNSGSSSRAMPLPLSRTVRTAPPSSHFSFTSAAPS